MNWMDQVGQLLNNYSVGEIPVSHSEVPGHFEAVAQAAPQSTISGGIRDAFNSDQTPPFSQMIASLFSQSSGDQKAGILNTILRTAAPGILSQLGLNSQSSTVSPEQAQNVSMEAVQNAASTAEAHTPGVIDMASDFYAAHPALVKNLGGAALTVVMASLAKRMKVM